MLNLNFAEIYLIEAAKEIDRPWIYAIPESFPTLSPGAMVMVLFGKAKTPRQAVVTRVLAAADLDENTKELVNSNKIKYLSAIASDSDFAVSSEQVELALYLRKQCFCTFGQALRVMIPSAVRNLAAPTQICYTLTDRDAALEFILDNNIRYLSQQKIIEVLLEYEALTSSEIIDLCQVSASTIRTLQKKGLLQKTTYSAKTVLTQDKYVNASKDEPFVANAEQKLAIAAICGDNLTSEEQADLRNNPQKLREYLLFGVTGSGKTEVYMQAADRFLQKGKTILILVPEISLTPLMTKRLLQRFHDQIAILHSRITPREKYENYRRIAQGEVKIVVGARSAVFAPLKNIGLIVVDEEQEQSYKSEQKPRYQALDIARKRAMLHGAVLVLGSATPKVTTFYRTVQGKAKLLTLNKRANLCSELPKVKIVDMRGKGGAEAIFASELKRKIKETLQSHKQIMLLVNRRGFTRSLLCADCGHVIECSHCNLPLTVHRHSMFGEQLICHHCERIYPMPSVCSCCGSSNLKSSGMGIQRVEQHLHELFPEAKVLRMDQDTTRGRDAHAAILQEFSEGKADILLGTQMIAKGHDFKHVVLAAILNADSLLGVGEITDQETAFQLMSQMAGRAGRGSEAGEVLIQTYQPSHFVINYAKSQDYFSFYQEEIKFRKAMNYPPFTHLGLIMITSTDYQMAEEYAKFCADILCQVKSQSAKLRELELSKSAPAPFPKLRDRFRFRILLFHPQQKRLTEVLRYLFDFYPPPYGVNVVFDTDPVSTL